MLAEAALVEYDHVIEALAANGADHSFDICTLPWGSRGRQHFPDSHRIYLGHKVLSKDAITVSQQLLWCAFPWKRFTRLLRRPETHRNWNRTVGTVKKSADTMLFTWFHPNLRERQSFLEGLLLGKESRLASAYFAEHRRRRVSEGRSKCYPAADSSSAGWRSWRLCRCSPANHLL